MANGFGANPILTLLQSIATGRAEERRRLEEEQRRIQEQEIINRLRELQVRQAEQAIEQREQLFPLEVEEAQTRLGTAQTEATRQRGLLQDEEFERSARDSAVRLEAQRIRERNPDMDESQALEIARSRVAGTYIDPEAEESARELEALRRALTEVQIEAERAQADAARALAEERRASIGQRGQGVSEDAIALASAMGEATVASTIQQRLAANPAASEAQVVGELLAERLAQIDASPDDLPPIERIRLSSELQALVKRQQAALENASRRLTLTDPRTEAQIVAQELIATGAQNGETPEQVLDRINRSTQQAIAQGLLSDEEINAARELMREIQSEILRRRRQENRSSEEDDAIVQRMRALQGSGGGR